ncbi:MAG: DUF401 family protein [Bacteroidota bacterium]
MSPLIALGLVLVVLVILVRLKLELGWSMLICAVALGLLSRLGPAKIARILGAAWWNGDAFNLAVSLVSILFLENIMRKNGYLQRVHLSLRALCGDSRAVMALGPAFLGLLPSPGGAVFSAPMVEEAAAGMGLTAEDKSVINYWYRHIWECSLPLYPGVILAAKIFQVPAGRLTLYQIPFTALAVFLGVLIAFRHTRRGQVAAVDATKRRSYLDLAIGVAPVLAVLLMVLVFGAEVWLAVVGIVLVLLALHRYKVRRLLDLCRESFSWRPILLVAGIMAFRFMLGTTGVVEALPKLFTGMGLPPVALVVLLPLTLAVLIGIGQGFVSASFPLLVGIVGLGAEANMGYIAVAYISGLTGMMLTPLHLCLVLTVQFYRADLGQVWRRIAPAMAVMLALAIPYGFWLF